MLPKARNALAPSLATPLDVRQGCVRRAAVAGLVAHSIIKLQRAARETDQAIVRRTASARFLQRRQRVLPLPREFYPSRSAPPGDRHLAGWFGINLLPEHAAGNRSRLFERRYRHAGGRKQHGKYEESRARLLTSCRLSGSGHTAMERSRSMNARRPNARGSLVDRPQNVTFTFLSLGDPTHPLPRFTLCAPARLATYSSPSGP